MIKKSILLPLFIGLTIALAAVGAYIYTAQIAPKTAPPAQSDFTGQYSFHDPESAASGTILAEQLSEKEINFALLVNRGAPSYNSGTIYKTKLLLDNNAAIYENNEYSDCKFKVIFDGEKAVVEFIDGFSDGGSDCGFGHAVYVSGVYPKINGDIPNFQLVDPRIGEEINLLPQGWEIIKKAVGDLNNDGIADVAIIMEDSEGQLRNLSILFADETGNYDLSIEADKAILLADEGGVFGDPLDSISINNGVLSIKFYGGSASRWSKIYKFRHQDGGWYLIGKTEHNYYNECPYQIFQTQDCNYSTGYMEKFTGDGWAENESSFACDRSLREEKGKKEWIHIGKKPLIDLVNFDPRIIN